MITHGHGEQFAEVIVNRVWQRYLGWGLMEPADDWEAVASHPQLLKWLAAVPCDGCDLKHVARLIMVARLSKAGDPRSLQPGGWRAGTGPARRRLTAEQVVDSLSPWQARRWAWNAYLGYQWSRHGRDIPESRTPRRAWQFTSLSNERDRPSLAIPKAQSVVDVLFFGWRRCWARCADVRTMNPMSSNPRHWPTALWGAASRSCPMTVPSRNWLCDRWIAGELVRLIYQRVLGRHPIRGRTHHHGSISLSPTPIAL